MAQHFVSFQTSSVRSRNKAGRSTTPKYPNVSGIERSTSEAYTNAVTKELAETIRIRVERIAATGGALPSPDDLADLLAQTLPDIPDDLSPLYADIAPFYTSDGAMRQLGGITKQALASRRTAETILAMRTGDGTWLYPAWQFTGDGHIHSILAPVLKAVRGVDRWVAGVWLTSEHPDLNGLSPRQALRNGVEPVVVANLATHDMARLAS